MSVLDFLLVLFLLAFVGVIPAWPYSRSWGYFPSSFLLVLLVVVAVMSWRGRARI